MHTYKPITTSQRYMSTFSIHITVHSYVDFKTHQNMSCTILHLVSSRWSRPPPPPPPQHVDPQHVAPDPQRELIPTCWYLKSLVDATRSLADPTRSLADPCRFHVACFFFVRIGQPTRTYFLVEFKLMGFCG